MPSHVSVVLDGTWSSRPWVGGVKAPPGGHPVRLSTTFSVPASLADQPVELELEGLWWSANVWLDGERLGAVVGGNPPVTTSLSEGLAAGDHTLSLVVAAPRGVSAFAHGGGLGSNTRPDHATLHRPPRLRFHTGSGVTSGGVRLHDAGATAWARVDPRRLPEGAQVHFFTALDGRRVTDFGTVRVGDASHVESVPTAPRDPLWSWGDPALTHLFVEVQSADGTVVDTWSVRTGLRSSRLTPSGLELNADRSPAVAVRVLHGLDEPDLLTVLEGAVPAGVNAVELHGDMVDSQVLSLADELGLPLVVLPRCVGRVGRPPGTGSGLADTLRAQDERTVRGVGAHPSVVSWLVEGDRQNLHPGRQDDGELDAWTSAIPADPMKRPVAGIDVPGTLLQITDLRTSATTCPAGCGGKWIVESTFRIVPMLDHWGAVARGWQAAFALGIPGGTLPTASDEERSAWAAAFSTVLADSGVRAFPLDRTRRASSRVRVTGLAPGALVWVAAPGTTLHGAQANDDGVAEVDLWFEGEATVHGPGWSEAVEVAPMTWRGTRLFGHVAEVAAPPGR